MSGEKILIVDDDLAHALLCQKLLDRAGYQPQSVDHAAEALERLQNGSFELLITDIRMPDMDGFELLSQAAKMDPGLAILMMTGFGTVENAVQALRYGADGLLLKPLGSASELLETVAYVLEKHRNQVDALRLRTLRPLFDLSEHFFSETTPEILSRMVVEEICNQTQSAAAGIIEIGQNPTEWKLIAGKNIQEIQSETRAQEIARLITEVIKREPVVLIPVDDPLLAGMTNFMKERQIRDLVCAPILRTRKNYVFFICRTIGQSSWRNPDLELLTIFARQAAIALENAHLYAELKNYVRKLEESQHSLILAEKMAALGRLMASLAHELNNPLQGIQNCLHLAERPDLPVEQRQEFIQMARKEVERVSGLAQTTLEYYRPKSLERVMVDPQEVVDEVLNLLSPRLREKQIEVFWSRLAPSVRIPVIRDHLQQVLLNLLLNAIDALNTIDPATIWIEVNQYDHGIEVCIEDNGNGLSPEIEARLFEPFTSTKPDGTGLGLSISYELIVDVHGGELGFTTPQHGQGARVRLYLPGSDG